MLNLNIYCIRFKKVIEWFITKMRRIMKSNLKLDDNIGEKGISSPI
jgi:hypothetical protein